MAGTSQATPVQIVLCFDGTGNTFRVDGTETNILKICRMSPRSDHQLVYYQPGIGTEITAGSLAATTLKKSSRLGKSKTLSQALGKSFDRHVLGGYRFLMRHYRQDGNIYIFGFSRGAYTARFLAEMLDYVGLLGPDNEEMIPFIWDAFSRWKLTRFNGTEQGRDEQKRAMEFLRHCRETLCRPMTRVRFVGLFDTVNSIADFEINNDDRSSARVIRHAVSIDECRVKFQPVLLPLPRKGSGRKLAVPADDASPDNLGGTENSEHVHNGGRRASIQNSDPNTLSKELDEDEEGQDVEEVWFPGSHADIGGGFSKAPGELWQLSHAPLVWMVQEAQRAGLEFDQQKLETFNCLGEEHLDPSSASKFREALQISSAKGALHDRLDFGTGLSAASVLAWRFMEYLPIRRASLTPSGSWKLVHWPLHRGNPRDMPLDAQIHGSAIHRMQSDSNYRPGNLIVGGGDPIPKDPDYHEITEIPVVRIV
ncbi:uncharacterized protein N7482_007565 [Penicillium canariense]|uniref:T6SS Phospholipase effector Tle1-like catalytic domain-containing protein n=1 Tax=Penicillium canariense TaxID=189055 RepID=A0A9W9LKQ2_9EURO|nr:uncharacterized protein N7482_007565 [Penicillium canariense]KAJ5160561.1 hypothetical protein N7482_007565 [Penicillium canariense]